MVKNQLASARDARGLGSIHGSGRFSEAGNGNPLPVFLPGKSPGQSSLVGYNSWGCKEEVKEYVCVCACVCMLLCYVTSLIFKPKKEWVNILITKARLNDS